MNMNMNTNKNMSGIVVNTTDSCEHGGFMMMVIS